MRVFTQCAWQHCPKSTKGGHHLASKVDPDSALSLARRPERRIPASHLDLGRRSAHLWKVILLRCCHSQAHRGDEEKKGGERRANLHNGFLQPRFINMSEAKAWRKKGERVCRLRLEVKKVIPLDHESRDTWFYIGQFVRRRLLLRRGPKQSFAQLVKILIFALVRRLFWMSSSFSSSSPHCVWIVLPLLYRAGCLNLRL